MYHRTLKIDRGFSDNYNTPLHDIARLDISVPARLCTALGCTIEDLLEFIPAENIDGKSI
ncbi:MAG: helix-turn-helix transcriptional regulator [Clostridiales bacterium]|nr:helix-turn-helix transcriptional regulator [Clostridiales bacterium]